MDVEGYEFDLIMAIDTYASIQKIQMELHPHVLGNKKIDKIKTKLESLSFNLNKRISSFDQLFFLK